MELLEQAVVWMGQEPTTVLLWGISFGTAILTAVSGAGGGILLLALMGTVLPAPWVVPLHGAVMTGTNASRAVLLWRHVDKWLVAGIAVGSLIGAMLAGPWVMQIPADAVSVVLGLGLLFLVWAPKGKGLPAWVPYPTVLLGVLTSMMSMVIGGAGMLFAAILQRQNRPKFEVLANQSVSLCLQHGLKTIVFALFGFAFVQHLPLLVGMLAMGWLGTWVGTQYLQKVSQAKFNLIFKWVVTVLAVRMLAIVLWP